MRRFLFGRAHSFLLGWAAHAADLIEAELSAGVGSSTAGRFLFAWGLGDSAVSFRLGLWWRGGFSFGCGRRDWWWVLGLRPR
jgi:hypothetical protein